MPRKVNSSTGMTLDCKYALLNMLKARPLLIQPNALTPAFSMKAWSQTVATLNKDLRTTFTVLEWRKEWLLLKYNAEVESVEEEVSGTEVSLISRMVLDLLKMDYFLHSAEEAGAFQQIPTNTNPITERTESINRKLDIVVCLFKEVVKRRIIK